MAKTCTEITATLVCDTVRDIFAREKGKVAAGRHHRAGQIPCVHLRAGAGAWIQRQLGRGKQDGSS